MKKDNHNIFDLNQCLAFAHRLADASGQAILPYFEEIGAIDIKADNSPVTQADRAAEAAMRELIEHEFPDHAIFGEEHGHKKTISEFTWVLDPIDGTRAFIDGRKEWGTLIALCSDGTPILGILNQPATGERWVGLRGEAASYQGNAVRTRPCNALGDAEISTTSALVFTPPQASQFVKLAQSCRHVVRDGDCYAYGLLARGARDLVVDAGLKPYDILALVPIIEAAGGSISTWEGNPVTLHECANVVAAGDKSLHATALALLQGT